MLGASEFFGANCVGKCPRGCSSSSGAETPAGLLAYLFLAPSRCMFKQRQQLRQRGSIKTDPTSQREHRMAAVAKCIYDCVRCFRALMAARRAAMKHGLPFFYSKALFLARLLVAPQEKVRMACIRTYLS